MRALTAIPLLLLTGALARTACAFPPFWTTVEKTYSVKADSDLGRGKCLTCHTNPGGGRRNAFGKEVQRALEKSGAGAVTAATLQSVESGDADGDGAKNGDELRAGTLPADPKSKPSRGEVAAPSRPVENAKDPRATDEPLIPRHSYHPALVHFPVALFAFAAFLLLFARGRRTGWADASRICAGGGAASLLVVLPTGLAAMLRLGIPIGGTMLVHLILGVLTAVAGLLAWRDRTERYRVWVLLAGGLALLTGHWGSMIVYGT